MHIRFHSNERCVTDVCFDKSECKQMEIYILIELKRQKIFIKHIQCDFDIRK